MDGCAVDGHLDRRRAVPTHDCPQALVGLLHSRKLCHQPGCHAQRMAAAACVDGESEIGCRALERRVEGLDDLTAAGLVNRLDNGWTTPACQRAIRMPVGIEPRP